MLKRFAACSVFAFALLIAMASPSPADDGCPVGGQSAGMPIAISAHHAETEPVRDETVVAPAPLPDPGEKEGESPPEESIGTGTMMGEGSRKDIPAFGGNAWEDILGIGSPRPDYDGPFRKDAGR